jgi:hypothetical protein
VRRDPRESNSTVVIMLFPVVLSHPRKHTNAFKHHLLISGALGAASNTHTNVFIRLNAPNYISSCAHGRETERREPCNQRNNRLSAGPLTHTDLKVRVCHSRESQLFKWASIMYQKRCYRRRSKLLLKSRRSPLLCC